MKHKGKVLSEQEVLDNRSSKYEFINFETMEKEEQKQYLIDIMKADEELGLYEEKPTPKERARNYMRLKKRI